MQYVIVDQILDLKKLLQMILLAQLEKLKNEALIRCKHIHMVVILNFLICGYVRIFLFLGNTH